MLDDNLKVLTRRLTDMELDLATKKERIAALERVNADTQAKLDTIYDE